MSTRQLKIPAQQRGVETPFSISQNVFRGMIKDIAPSELPEGYAYRNININDYDKWADIRPGTRRYTATSIPYTKLNSRLDHKTLDIILTHGDNKVYYSTKAIPAFTEILCLHPELPEDSVSKLIEYEREMILCAGNIYRIFIDGTYRFMYRINLPIPTNMLVSNYETRTFIYGHRYLYGLARITGTGNRNRLTENCELVMETGNAKNGEDYFGECYFANPIGVDLTQNHLIGYMACPLACQEITHFSIYRTMNIGSHSNGQSNNPALFIWVEDAPVAKAFRISINGNVATIVNPTNKFQYGDVGNVLYDSGGNSGVIESYTDENNVNLVVGHTFWNTVFDVAYGEGRVFTANQVNTLIIREGGAAFVAADVGRTMFWADGGFTMITAVDVTAQTATALFSENHVSQSMTMQATAGTNAFRRKFNDTIKDDGKNEGDIGLVERILAHNDYYYPNFNFEPMPDANTGVIDSGFLISCNRDDNKFYYSQLGSKKYLMGQYRKDIQFERLPSGIREIIVFPALAIFLLKNKTFNNSLSVSKDLGNNKFGETVFKLMPSNEADGRIGVYFYQSIQPIEKSLLIALTNEPAIRMFDGHNWSERNYANEGNFPAVMKDLNSIEPSYDVISGYSQLDGYLLWFYKWIDTQELCDDIIIDHGGTGWPSEDVYIDHGGTGITGNDVIVDVGNTVCPLL